METNNTLVSTILDTDSYKFSHWVQYPPGTTEMFSYLESRGGKYESTVFFGLQYALKRFLDNPVTAEQVEEAAEFAKNHGVPFNLEGWEHIVAHHGGRLPVRIRAVPEGTIVPTGNILMSVESTDPKVFWVVSWLETMLVRLWFPITVATKSYYCKQAIRKALEKSSDNPETELPFKLHDFGSRGTSSQESAMIGGAAHLVNFMGSDTVAGIYTANKYYNHHMAAFSIPAAEHSTMTMWGREREVDAYANMLKQYGDDTLIAVVSDSYDIFNAAENIWGDQLKSQVEEFDGMLVIRPDSGDPATVVVKLLNILHKRFGGKINGKGYKVLDHVRVLQGDGINEDSLQVILDEVLLAGFSADNIAFGMGGGLLQQLNRDTCKFAFKCSYAKVDGEDVDVWKDPATDKGKRSKKGKLELLKRDDGSVLTTRRSAGLTSVLRDVYLDGKILIEDDLDTIRARTREPLVQYKGWVDRSA
jgi:nicotinamide phosphoribosyltransferase